MQPSSSAPAPVAEPSIQATADPAALPVSTGDAATTVSSGGGGAGAVSASAAAAATAETSTSLATGVVAQPSAESSQAVGETAVEATALSMGDVKEALPEMGGAAANVDTVAAVDAAEEEVWNLLLKRYYTMPTE